MLEIKNLTKVYTAKGGAETRALDDVSVSFGETGLVFLLGKSGSGKSTLLNLAGGLDSPTSGEVIVMGKSSKDFSGADFDSYRNTFIGFIFQEYNVLDEFTVEDNIALALELQGKPKDKAKIQSILKDVELESFARRKPNTLSGGQKQRIAIARALIKDPQIIMADEPTGALDSATGKQVFDTLKSLSKTRLVLVVSHDREFAEIYGDRIIELKDGKIVSDVTKEQVPAQKVSENVRRLGPDTLTVQGGRIDGATLKEIEDFLKDNEGEVLISKGKGDIASFRRANRIGEDGARERFGETKDVDLKEYDGKKTKFIKSRMPLGRAIKMGASGLKTKPFRLIFTILLSVVAFVMFGVLSTFMLYDPNYSISQALQEADYPSIAVQKSYTYYYESWVTDKDGNDTLEYASDYPSTSTTLFGVQELKDKNASGPNDYAGLFNFTNGGWNGGTITFALVREVDGNTTLLPVSIKNDVADYYNYTYASAFTDCGAEYMQRNGFTLLAGSYPKDKTEVALPNYLADLFVNTNDSGIATAEQLVGKKIRISAQSSGTIPSDASFTVSGVYNVGTIPEKYNDLKNGASISPDQKETLQRSMNDFLDKSFFTIVYVTEDFYEAYKYEGGTDVDRIEPKYYNGIRVETSPIDYTIETYSGDSFYTEETLQRYPDAFKFFDLDGNEKTFSVSGTQVWITEREWRSQYADSYSQVVDEMTWKANYDPEAYAYFQSDDWRQLRSSFSYDKASFDAVMAAVDKWYETLAEKSFLMSLASELTYAIELYNEKETWSDFIDSVQRINNIMNEEFELGKATEADWTVVKSALEELKASEKYSPFVNKYYFNRLMNSSNEMYQTIESAAQEAGYEIWDVGNLDPMYMPEEFAAKAALIERLVNEYYETAFGCKAGEETFEPVPTPIKWECYYKDYLGNSGELEIVGYFTVANDDYGWVRLMSSSFLEEHMSEQTGDGNFYWSKERTDYVPPEDAKYNFILALTDNTQEEISAALASDNGSVVYDLTNRVYSELTMFVGMITDMQTIFLIVGLVVGVFAALMLLNFISVSISAKKKEIGILRAVGARGSDAFKIFFSESLIIAIICFVIASVGSFFVCGALNNSLSEIVTMQLLNFNIVNILLILAISLGISFIATFFPVWMAAKKKPVESIRAL